MLSIFMTSANMDGGHLDFVRWVWLPQKIKEYAHELPSHVAKHLFSDIDAYFFVSHYNCGSLATIILYFN